MHGRLYNQATFHIALRPRTPLLIKAGQGQEALDPTLPDMSFVRTLRGGTGEPREEIFIPGSSLRGVVRAHAERLLRTVKPGAACNPLVRDPQKSGTLRPACSPEGRNEDEDDEGRQSRAGAPQAYQQSCYACRLFGNTSIASRVRFSDFFLAGAGEAAAAGVPAPLTETRYGVAIDRVTGAVAHGPFELETVTDALFTGLVEVRNFTVGQFGLLAAALLDLSDGYVAMGYGKSRGLGLVELIFLNLKLRYGPRTPLEPRRLWGVGDLAPAEVLEAYGLRKLAQHDHLEIDAPAGDSQTASSGELTTAPRFLATIELKGEQVRSLLEKATSRWVEEVQ
ncbi:MAG: hypothetical protein IMX00_08745 [Limnochordales bacterium]|nr:hypothetical protein [Limnochordales bacterium]